MTYPAHALEKGLSDLGLAEEYLTAFIQDRNFVEHIVNWLTGLVDRHNVRRSIEICIHTEGFDESEGGS